MNRPTKKRTTPDAVTDDERSAQYDYLLNVLPRVIVERAHAAAIVELPAEQRDRMLAQAPPGIPDAGQRITGDDPDSLAALVRCPDLRETFVRAGVADAIALAFVRSAPVAQYFEVGAGSVEIDRQPIWVQDLAHYDANPIDGGTVQHPKSRAMGMWGA